ncbi:PDZ domain-containing protein [Granulicella sibirica]|uniref:Serine protease MucD/AlgY associated with sigma factor RpoE n=1 Tax=Granulicella sibirica TaxID=2479048 RepID=A0A4Q0T254_9BACT|nr:PDZ domain-containing protein [Granulicella sibirica]RXH57735.1 Serine protease precursor MucD/AlgY associated with sigma factor RpoE [Granulicella sibirica]
MKDARTLRFRAGWHEGSFAQTAVAAVVLAGLSHGSVAFAQHLRLPDHLGLPVLHGAAFQPTAAAGRSNQGYLGVDIRDVNEASLASARARTAKDSKDPRGAEIVRVDHDGPAGKAGLHEHDIVLQVNGQAIDTGEQLRRLLHDAPPGRSLTLTINRDGQSQTIAAQMGNREDVEREAWEEHVKISDPEPLPPAPETIERRGTGFFSSPGRVSRNLFGGIGLSPGYTGVLLERMAPQLAEYFGAQGKTGLLVRSVDPNSPAAVAGLHAGDVVMRVNGNNIASSSDWFKTIRENKGRPVNVIVLRDRQEQTLTMVPNAKHHSSLIPDMWPHLGGSRATFQPASQVEQACVALGTLSMM